MICGVIVLGKTPDIFVNELKITQMDLVISKWHEQNAMKKAIHEIHEYHYHGLSPATLAQIPSALNDPLAVIKENKIEALLPLKDSKGLYILTPIEINVEKNNKSGKANIVLTAYGKDKYAKYIKRAIENNKYLYPNEQLKKSHLMSIMGWSKFPSPIDLNNSTNSISPKTENVNSFDKNKSKKEDNKDCNMYCT